MKAAPTAPIQSLLGWGEWGMLPGERAALEGILSALRPTVSIEIGTYRGDSLEQISAHSRVVHAFDQKPHREVTPERFPNVTFHIGNSHELLPRVLEQLVSSNTNVDFALVDGDHSAPGARRDVEDLLSSTSVGRTVIVLHDTLNERVRAGLEQIDFCGFDKVRFVDLDFVQGRVMLEGPQTDELWYGLGLVVTGWDVGDGRRWPKAYAAPDLYEAFSKALSDEPAVDRPSYRRLGYKQLIKLEDQLAEQRNIVTLMQRSWSWRLTAPVRTARQLARQLLARG